MRIVWLLLVVILASSIFGCTRTIESKHQETTPGENGQSTVQTTGPAYSPKIESHGDYELMLPKDYSSEKTYPLLFCLHPDAKGKQYVEALKPLAKDSGWIIAASNEYRNNYGGSIKALADPVEEIKKNHQVSEVYLCGFSGGCAVSYIVAYMNPSSFEGIVCNDGAFQMNFRPGSGHDIKVARLKKVVIMSGNRDTVVTPDYLKADGQLLKQAGVETHFISFSGGHQLAPVEKYREALEWLEND